MTSEGLVDTHYLPSLLKDFFIRAINSAQVLSSATWITRYTTLTTELFLTVNCVSFLHLVGVNKNNLGKCWMYCFPNNLSQVLNCVKRVFVRLFSIWTVELVEPLSSSFLLWCINFLHVFHVRSLGNILWGRELWMDLSRTNAVDSAGYWLIVNINVNGESSIPALLCVWINDLNKIELLTHWMYDQHKEMTTCWPDTAAACHLLFETLLQTYHWNQSWNCKY